MRAPRRAAVNGPASPPPPPSRRAIQRLAAAGEGGAARADAAEAGQAEKLQAITYYKSVDNYHVRDVPVDFLGAMREMETLPVATGPYRFIGFENRRNGDNVQFIRIGEDRWYVDVPIDGGRGWDGYFWGTRTDTGSVSDLLRLFFEEMPWLGMLPFTMRRYRP